MAKKTKTDSPTKAELHQDLATDVLQMINKAFKDFPNAMGMLSDANMATGWISTGSDILDLAISNRPHGGIPLGFVSEIHGQSGSSKSLLAAHIMASCQKQGGLAVLFDTEKAVGVLDFYKAIGLQIEKTMYTDAIRTLEEIYDAIERIILRTVESNTDKPLVIVVDSVMGASTKAELEDDYEKDGWNTAKAIINSKAMRKLPSLIAGRKIAIVLINQLRANMNAGFGGDPFCVDPFTTKIKVRYKK